MQLNTGSPEPMISNTAKARTKERDAALEDVLATTSGRLVFAEIFKAYHMYSTPYNDHGSKQSFIIGQQSVCFELRQWMKNASVYMKYYHLLEKEEMDRTNKWEQEDFAEKNPPIQKKKV